MQKQKSPVTKDQLNLAKVTIKGLKQEWNKAITFFVERDNYKKDLKGWIKKYGIANLPESVQRTIPTDMKVLYEIKWWLQPFVWFRIIQLTILNTQNEGLRRVQNG